MDPLDRLLQSQLGLLTHQQAVAVLGQSRLQRWARSGRLVEVHPRVYRAVGSPVTWHQRLLAAQLGAGNGAAISHRSAAALWELTDATDLVDVVIPHGRTVVMRGVVVHRCRDTIESRRRHGLLVTTPMRTLVDLGAVCRPWEVEFALERGLVARLFSVAAVEWELTNVRRRGRRGAGVLGEILDTRALGAVAPDSILEPRMMRLIRAAGLPEPVFQYAIGLYRVDFAYPELRIVIEVDGWATHSSPAALAADLERQNALVLAGWTVLRFTWADIVKNPAKVARAIANVLCRAVVV